MATVCAFLQVDEVDQKIEGTMCNRRDAQMRFVCTDFALSFD